MEPIGWINVVWLNDLNSRTTYCCLVQSSDVSMATAQRAFPDEDCDIWSEAQEKIFGLRLFWFHVFYCFHWNIKMYKCYGLRPSVFFAGVWSSVLHVHHELETPNRPNPVGSIVLSAAGWSWSAVGFKLLIMYIEQEEVGRRIFILSVVLGVIVVVLVKHTQRDNHGGRL